MVGNDLQRFERHHPDDFRRALGEIETGRKQTHWMWFVFPQLISLGRSATSIEYGISSVDEAERYLRHPVLGRDYGQIVAAVWDRVVRHGDSITALMGSPDDLKLISSLTLFGTVARRMEDPRFTTVADLCDDVLAAATAQGFAPCRTTVEFLRR